MRLLCVQWKTPGDGQRNCPKHVEIHTKNKFEKLVHLVGFIIRYYHDARSPERQNKIIIIIIVSLLLTNAQLFHKLSHSYMFRHYRVILRQLAINTLPSYTSISNAAVGNTIYN